MSLTYDLQKELDAFIGDFIWRNSFNYPNYWITKPVASAKSIDMNVSNNLDFILRTSETGNKIICKYIENPLRFRGVKFDIRQFVLVRSVVLLSCSSSHLRFTCIKIS